jgi:hypothetical protein
MANIFLNYAHEDKKKAAPFANALYFLKLCRAIHKKIKSKIALLTCFLPSNNVLNKAVEHAKTIFLKRSFRMWNFTILHQTLAIIGGELNINITGSWQSHQLIANNPTETTPKITVSSYGIAKTKSMTATVMNGGIAMNDVIYNYYVGIPPFFVKQIVIAPTKILPEMASEYKGLIYDLY